MSLTREIKAANKKLCQAIEKNAAIYDRSHPNYGKKAATENSWDMVAEECEESVVNCKTRWQQICEEYSRCYNNSPNQSAKMKKFYLQDVLRFLTPHMTISADYWQDKWEHDNKTEKASKAKNIGEEKNENSCKIDERSDYKNNTITGENKQVKAKKVQAEALVTAAEIIQLDYENRTMGKNEEQITFYMKPTCRDSRTRSISKVTDPLETITDLKEVQEKSNLNNGAKIPVETRNIDPLDSEEFLVLTERRKSRRYSKRRNDEKHESTSTKATSLDLHGVKESFMQKPGTRITRLQNRRMSISATSASNMTRDSIASVKLISVPKTQQSSQFQQQQLQRRSSLCGKQDEVLSNLEMFAESQTSDNQQVIDKLIDNKYNDDLFQGQSQQDIEQNKNGNKSKRGNMRGTSSPSSLEKPTTNALRNHSIAVKELASTESDRSLQDRSVQCGLDDNFTDDDFLNIIRPQMREMNARQKMHFKKKVFQSLMEVFDDATDFPNAGDVQHFNINTPSGFESTTNEELHLLRELVSLVTAAKNTKALQKTNCLLSGRNSPADTVSTTTNKNTNVHQSRDELGLPRNVIQRVIRVTEGGDGTGVTTINADKRCIYRIVPKSGTKVVVNSCNKNSTTSNTSQTYNIGVSSGNFSPVRQLIPCEVPTTNSACTLVVPTTVTKAWSPITAPKFPISNNIVGANNTTNTYSVKRTRQESNGEAIPGLLSTNSRSNSDLNTAANVSRLGCLGGTASSATRIMARRYSVCGLPAAGNTKFGTESNARNVTTMASGLLNSNAVSTANANGVQISLKRRLENHVNSFLTSRAGPSGLVKVVGQKALALSPKENSIGQITSDAGRVNDFLSPATPVRTTSTGKLTNRSVYIQSTSNTIGACDALNLLSSSTLTSNTPEKRIAQITQVNVRRNSQKGLTRPKVLGKALNQLFNDNEMATAATIAADDFTTVRVKQEDDELLGM